MRHVLFEIPYLGWQVPSFGMVLVVGFLGAVWWATRRAMRSGANPDVILDCGFVALIAGIVGCRAMFVVHYWPQFAGAAANPLHLIWQIVDVRHGGMEYYGGFLFSTLAVLVYLGLWKRVSVRWYLDIIAPSVMLGLAVGRIGCFLNGCCFGKVCEAPWAVTFPYASAASMAQWEAGEPGAALPKELVSTDSLLGFPQLLARDSLIATDAEVSDAANRESALRARIAELEKQQAAAIDPTAQSRLKDEQARLRQQLISASARLGDLRRNMMKYNKTAAELRTLAAQHRSLPVHPTQLYSVITAGLLALLLNALYARRTRDGQVMCILLILEPITRWLLEAIRADNPIDTAGFTISQFLAMAQVMAGLVGLLVLQALSPRSRRAALWTPEQETRAAARPA